MKDTHPILSCEISGDYEARLLGGEAAKEWTAMNRAGRLIGREILKDFREIGTLPDAPSVLVLAGKGNNGGDALLAAAEIIKHKEDADVTVILMSSTVELKPGAEKALNVLMSVGGSQVEVHLWHGIDNSAFGHDRFDICIDGLLGLSFRPPVRSPYDEVIQWINDFSRIGMRAAVDLPSGIGDKSAEIRFRADFTYSPGIAKAPLFEPENATSVGRIRYLDIGFFDKVEEADKGSFILVPTILDSLKQLRDPQSDKRDYGHVFVLGGSRFMPGAALMSVLAAVRSGAGLVTALVPESMVPSMAAACPEAMWVPWPESNAGGLCPEGFYLLAQHLRRDCVFLVGPGMLMNRDSVYLLQRIVSDVPLPLVMDATATQPQILGMVKGRPKGSGPVVVTPHLGEFKRMAELECDAVDAVTLKNYCETNQVTTVLKGPTTRICDGQRVVHSTFGGPILARGGSGDILGGMIAAQMARSGGELIASVCRAVAWHGQAANYLAQRRGHEAVRTTELLDQLSLVLRDEML